MIYKLGDIVRSKTNNGRWEVIDFYDNLPVLKAVHVKEDEVYHPICKNYPYGYRPEIIYKEFDGNDILKELVNE